MFRRNFHVLRRVFNIFVAQVFVGYQGFITFLLRTCCTVLSELGFLGLEDCRICFCTGFLNILLHSFLLAISVLDAFCCALVAQCAIPPVSYFYLSPSGLHFSWDPAAFWVLKLNNPLKPSTSYAYMATPFTTTAPITLGSHEKWRPEGDRIEFRGAIFMFCAGFQIILLHRF